MQFSELTRDAGRQLSVSWDFIIVWPLCVHGEFRDVLSNNNVSNFAVFFIFINTNNARGIEIGQYWFKFSFQYPQFMLLVKF